MLGLKDKNQQSLYTLTTLQTLAPDLFSFTDSAVGDRVSKISGKYVQGEALTSSYPYNGFTALGAQVSLVHGPTTVDPWDLHSRALLTTFLLDDRFRQVTYQLTDLLGMLFDSRLYANPTNENKENFLDRLVRHQIGNAPGVTTADNMLTRFTDDLKKITVQGDLSTTNEDIVKALTAFAMQMYYDGPNATNKDKELFDTTGITGGLHFDRRDVAADLNKAKGFDRYFRNYLNFMLGAEINLSALEAIKKQLPELLDWYIQVGSSPMTASAGDQRAFILGGERRVNRVRSRKISIGRINVVTNYFF